MSIKTYKNGSWQDASGVKTYKNGSWQEVSSGKVYRNGAWQEVYPTLPKLGNTNDAFYLFKNKILNTYPGIHTSIATNCPILNDSIALPVYVSGTSLVGGGITISRISPYVWRHKYIYVFTKGGGIQYYTGDGSVSSPNAIATAIGNRSLISTANCTYGYIQIISGTKRYDYTYLYAIVGTDVGDSCWDGVTGL